MASSMASSMITGHWTEDAYQHVGKWVLTSSNPGRQDP